jgi:release factor glutamine methyltransferase
MPSIQSFLSSAILQLRTAGSPTPVLDAQIWLAHVLGWSRTRLLAHPEKELSRDEVAQFEEGLARLVAGEPLPYLTGLTEFYGLTFHVSPATLIPRPETEHLVEAALDLLATRTIRSAQLGGFSPRVADIGTGSGCIAVSLGVHLPDAQIYATDISQAALDVATRNARRHNVAERISFLQGYLLDPLPDRVDLIVANLPYIADHEWDDLPVSVREHEPTSALRGGSEGLDLVEELLRNTPAVLQPGGALLLEIGAYQGAAALALAHACLPGARVELQQDFVGRDRLLLVESQV